MPLTTPLIIGLCGPAGSGKDTVRSFLEHKHEFAGLAFAEPIRAMVRELLTSNGCSDEYITNRELQEAEIPGLGVSARHMMQTLGDWGRSLHPDFWMRMAATRTADLRGQGYRHIVASDVRFANEAEWVRAQGGEIWMLERPGLAPVRKHVSECVQFRVDQVLRNDGSLAKLEHTALDALASAKRFARAGREAA